jgi:hypothetical protein
MSDKAKHWQDEAAKAFTWLDQTYQQAQALLDDSQALFDRGNWEVKWGSGWGGAAMSNWNLADWPFIFLKSFAVRPREQGWEAGESAGFFGIIFYDGDRKAGPQCFGATGRWTDMNVNCDHWMLYEAIGGNRPARKFVTSSTGGIRVSRPKPDATRYKGFDELKWFEVPLASLDSPERLEVVVEATKRLYEGRDEVVLTSLAGITGP